MCIYSRTLFACGHGGIPLIARQCSRERNQLYRIYDPREPQNRIPYNAYIPECEPNRSNVISTRVDQYCPSCEYWRSRSRNRGRTRIWG
jgi:hypothetical protein